MLKSGSFLVAAVLLAGSYWAAGAFGADENKADRTDIRGAQKLMHSQIVAERVEGIARLRDTSAQDAVKLIVPAGLTDPAEEVRRAAYETLLAWKNDRQIDVFLLKALEKETRTNKQGVMLCAPLIAVLLASESADTRQEIDKFLDAYTGSSGKGKAEGPVSPEHGGGTAAKAATPAESKIGAAALATMVTVADELGKLGDRQSLASLKRMTGLKCFSSTYAIRRAVVQAIIQVHLPEAVAEQISLLPDVDGEIRGDILRQLSAVSGQTLGPDAKNWQAWWEKNKDDIRFPANGASTSSLVAAAPGTPTYYGLAVQARRLVFVIDISGSMEGPRLATAKRELAQVIQALPEDAAFSIVVFSDHALVWQRSLKQATPAMKKAAIGFVSMLYAGGHTAAYDALEAAFQFDAEAVYFLSDGAPNAGKIPAPGAILAAVTQANRGRRISIYTIGIAPGEAGGPLDNFMRALAEQNFGVYRRVDE